MKLLLRRNAPLFYALAAMLALYIPWLNRGFNNYEFPILFAGRALAIATDAGLIEAYWPNMANPLGYSLALSLIYRIFGFSDDFWISRVPALLGATLLLLSGWLITDLIWKQKKHLFYIWSSLVVLHPMIMVFSTTGTTDLLPVGLLMIAVTLALRSNDDRFSTKIVIGVLFGFATIVKYNSVYFGFALIAASILQPQVARKDHFKKIRNLAAYILVPSLILGFYLYWSNNRFGIFISSRLKVSQPNFFDLLNLTKNLIKYLSFFGLFLAALPLIAMFDSSNKLRLGKTQLLYLMFSAFIIGWYYSGTSVGELEFGRFIDPIDPVIRRIVESFGAVLGLCALVVFLKDMKSRSKTKTVMLSGILPYLVLISASYPSQRYLTFVIPGSLLVLVDVIQRFEKRKQILIFSLSMFIFAAVSLLGMSYLTSQGNASEEMAVWVEENNLISQTSAGAIWPHAGQHFWGVKTTEIRYEIIAVTPATEAQVQERILHREPMKVLGKVTRIYLLRELPKAP